MFTSMNRPKYAHSFDSFALERRNSVSSVYLGIGSGAGSLKFKALIRWASRHQRVICISLIVQTHLHLVNIKITYKNIDIFYIDPLSDLRPDLGASGCRDFDNVTSFAKFKILLVQCARE